MAPSALAAQLAAMRPKDTEARSAAGGLKNRASLLYTPSEAAEIDAESIHTLGLAGLAELQRHDASLSRFEKTLFIRSVTEFRREQQTAEVVRSLDASIRGLLNAISPFFLLRASMQVLEYLIRRYSVHEHNVDALLECALPYHSTLQFVRLVQLTAPTGRWSFLEAVKKSGSPLSRSVLAGCCAREHSLLRFVGDVAKAEGSGRAAINMFLSVVAEVLAGGDGAGHRVDDALTLALMPALVDGLRAQKRPDLQAACYMVASLLARRATLKAEATDTLLRVTAQHAPRQDPSGAVLALAAVCHFQRPTDLSEGTFAAVAKLPGLPGALRAAAGECDVGGLLTVLLPAMAGHVAEGGSAKDLKEIVSTIRVGGHAEELAGVIIRECVELASGGSKPSSADEYKGERELSGLLRALALHYPAQMDAALTRQLAEGAEHREEALQLLSATFRGTRHAPVPQAGTTLLLALEHPASAVRVAALQQLGQQQQGGGEDAGFAAEAVMRRMADEDEGVALAALALAPSVARTHADALMEVLCQVLGPVPSSHASPSGGGEGQTGRSRAREEALRAMVGALAAAPGRGGAMAARVAARVLGLCLVCKATRRLNVLALKLASGVPHPGCAGLSEVWREWREGGSGGGDDAGLVELNLAVVKRIAESACGGGGGEVAEALEASGSDMLRVLVGMRCVAAEERHQRQAAFAADLASVVRKVVATLPGGGGGSKGGGAGKPMEVGEGGLPGAKSLAKRFFVTDGAGPKSWRRLCDCAVVSAAASLPPPPKAGGAVSGAHADGVRGLVRLALCSPDAGLVGGPGGVRSLLEVQVPEGGKLAYLADLWRAGGGEAPRARAKALMVAASLIGGGSGGGLAGFREVLPLVLAAVCDKDAGVRRAAVTCLVAAKGLGYAPDGRKVKLSDKAPSKSQPLTDRDTFTIVSALAASRVELSGDAGHLSVLCAKALLLDDVVTLDDDGDADMDSEERMYGQLFPVAFRERFLRFLLGAIATLSSSPSSSPPSLSTDLEAPTILLRSISGVLRPYLALPALSPLVPLCLSAAEAGGGGGATAVTELGGLALGACFNNATADKLADRDVGSALGPLLGVLASRSSEPAAASLVARGVGCVSSGLYASLPDAAQRAVFSSLLALAREAAPEVAGDVRARLRVLPVSPVHIAPVLEAAAAQLSAASEAAHDESPGKKARKEPKKKGGAGDGHGDGGGLGGEHLDAATVLEAIQSHAQPLMYAGLSQPLCAVVSAANACGGEGDGAAAGADDLRYGALASLEAVLSSVGGSDSGARSGAWKGVDVAAVCGAVRLAASAQGRHQALRVLSMAASAAPKAVARHMMPVFTYLGDSALRSDDAYTYHVVEKALEATVPPLVGAGLEPAALLQVFSDSFDAIPSHRRLRLVTHLVGLLKPPEHTHVFCSFLCARAAVRGRQAEGAALSFCASLYAQFPARVQLPSLARVLDEVAGMGGGGGGKGGGGGGQQQPPPPLQLALLRLLVRCLSAGGGFGQAGEADEEGGKTLLRLLRGLLALGRRGAEAGEGGDLAGLAEEGSGLVGGMLSVRGFVSAVSSLVSGGDLHLKQRALQLLAARMAALPDNPPEEHAEVLLSLLPAVRAVLTAAGRGEGDALGRQQALVCVSLMAAKMGALNRKLFAESAAEVTACLGSTSPAVAASACACVASLTQHLGMAMLPRLTKCLPGMVEMTLGAVASTAAAGGGGGGGDGEEDQVVLAVAGLGALDALCSSVPALMSPYVAGILDCASHPAAACRAGDVGDAARRAADTLVAEVAPRVLVPALAAAWGRCAQSGCEDSAVVILGMVGKLSAGLDATGVAGFHRPLFGVMLEALGTRAAVLGARAAGGGRAASILEDYARVELAALEAVGALVLKLNETRFKPLFARLVEWGAPPPDAGGGSAGAVAAAERVGRAVALCRTAVSLCELLKSIAVPYLTHLLDLFVAVLSGGGGGGLFPSSQPGGGGVGAGAGGGGGGKKKKRKAAEAVGGEEGGAAGEGLAAQRRECVDLVLSVLGGALRFDTLGFVTKERFEALMPPLVGILEDPEVGPAAAGLARVDDLLAPAVAQLAVAVQAGTGSDLLWKPLNRNLLNLFSDTSPRVRAGAIGCARALVDRVGDEYVTLVPETVPALVEALEDADEEVEARARELTGRIEDLLGESLNDYLVAA